MLQWIVDVCHSLTGAYNTICHLHWIVSNKPTPALSDLHYNLGAELPSLPLDKKANL